LRGLAGSLGYGAGAVSAGAGAGAVKGAAIGLGGGATKIGVVAVLVLGAGAGATALATRDITKTQATAVTAPNAAGRTSPSSLQPRLDPRVTAAARSNPEPTSPPTEGAAFAASPIANDTSPTAVSNAKPSVGTTPKGVPLAAASPVAEPPVAAEGVGANAAQPDHPPPETEFSLLEQAQRALRTDPQRALGLADADEKRFPSGALAQERDVIAIEALVQLGRADEASARARRFFRAFPGSAHGPRIAALLGFDASIHNP
jgi:hypothetical protein